MIKDLTQRKPGGWVVKVNQYSTKVNKYVYLYMHKIYCMNDYQHVYTWVYILLNIHICKTIYVHTTYTYVQEYTILQICMIYFCTVKHTAMRSWVAQSSVPHADTAGCCVLKFPIWAKTFPRKTRNKQFSLQFFTVQTRHDLFEPGCRTFQVWWTQQTQRTEQTSWNCGAILVSVWQCLVSTGEAILDLAITWRVHTSTTEHWTCAFDVLTRASMC